MRVYVESNFVLELVRRQKESPSCESLLTLAEAEEIELAIPAYSLAEPNETIRRAQADRTRLVERVRRELRQVGRSVPFANRAQDVELELAGLLDQALSDDWDRLAEIRERLVVSAHVVPLTAAVFSNAQSTAADLSLSPQDALVFASVLRDLEHRQGDTSLFLTRDGDFDDPDVRAPLHDLGCDVIGSYESGLRRVEARLK